MSNTSHRTTSESQAVKRAKARAGAKRGRMRALSYYMLHHWLPKGLRK